MFHIAFRLRQTWAMLLFHAQEDREIAIDNKIVQVKQFAPSSADP